MSLYNYLQEHHADILRRFIESSGAVAGAVINQDCQIVNWNDQFAELASRDISLNVQLTDVAVPLRSDTLPLPAPNESWTVNLQFQDADEDGNQCEFHIFNDRGEYILLSNQSRGTSDQVAVTMTRLNQQMGSLNRELQKKTQALQQAKTKIEQMARTDEMTQLANRRHLQQELDTTLSASRRHGFDVGIIMADVDRFKTINDTCGHETGDDVLKAVATVLEKCSRTEDLPARWVGDEFIILMPHTSAEEAQQVAERIRQDVKKACYERIQRDVSMSFGVTEFRPPENSKELMKRADEALYQSKQEGADQVSVQKNAST